MTNMARFFLEAVCNWVHMPTAQWCCSSRHLGANPTASIGNGTSADDDRMQVDSLKRGKRRGKNKNQHQRGHRTTNTSSADINTCKNCGKLGGGAYDNSACRNTGKGKRKNTGEGKGKHMDVVETEQLQPSETASTVSYPSQDPCCWRTLVHFNVDHWCDTRFRVIHKERSWCRAFAS